MQAILLEKKVEKFGLQSDPRGEGSAILLGINSGLTTGAVKRRR